MKSFDKIILCFTVTVLVLLAVSNILLMGIKSKEDKMYRVELNGIVHEISENGEASISGCKYITGIYPCDEKSDFYGSEYEYVIREIDGVLYRIEYDHGDIDNTETVIAANASICVLSVVCFTVLFYVRRNIVKPFDEISELPYELAKGNLSIPLKENRNRYFGKFIWGLDMLREELEQTNVKRLEQAKNEKTLMLSLSHDIKTPLSAIKLYAKALLKGLYTDKKKQTEVIGNIGEKADEIESFLNELIRNTSEDFFTFEINMTEFYMSEVIGRINSYYSEKLSLLSVEFYVESCGDCLLSGDPDRLEEVLQNIMENAVKYGDGRKITMTFSDEEDCRLISVTNSGCTLSESELPYIFDSFRRGSNVGAKTGSGLGLFICRKLMNGMGGEIFANTANDEMCVTVVCRKN